MKIFELFGTVALQGAEKVVKDVENVGKKAETLGKQVEILGNRAEVFNGKFSSIKKVLDDFGKKSEEVGKKIETFGKSTEELGKGLTTTVSAPLLALGGIFGLNTKEAANFEEQMLNVRAITNSSAEDYEKLTAKARELGASTKFSAQEAGKGMEYLGMAGWSTGQIMEGITPILELAEATTTDLGTTADIVSGNLAAFGLEAKDTSRVTDLLAKASTTSKVNVVSLGESLKYAAPMANSLGMSIEETSAMLGLFANSNIGASQAGTTMNAVMRDLTKLMSKESAPVFKKLGIEVFDELTGKMKPMPEIINLISNATKNMTDEQKNNLLQSGFNEQSLLGINVLLQKGGDELQKYTDTLNNSTGAVKSMRDIIKDGLNYQLIAFKSAVSEVSIKMGNILLPIMKEHVIPVMYSMLDAVDKLVTWFSGLSQSTQIAVLKWGGFLALLGPSIILIGKIVAAVGVVIKSFKSMSAIFSLTTLKVISWIAAAAGIAIIGTMIYKSWEDVSNGFKKIWDLMGLWIDKLKLNIQIAFKKMEVSALDFIDNTVKKLKILEKLPFGIGDSFKEFGNAVTDTSKQAQSELAGLNGELSKTNTKINNTKLGITGDFKSAGKEALGVVKDVNDGFNKLFGDFKDNGEGIQENFTVTMDDATTSTGNLVNATGDLTDAQGKVIEGLSKEQIASALAKDEKEDKTEAAKKEREALEREKNALDQLVNSYEKEAEINSLSISQMQKRQEEIDKELSTLDKSDKTKKEQIKLLEDEKKALDKTIVSLENKKTANDLVIESLKDEINPLDKTIYELEKKNKAIDDSLIALEKQGISTGKNVESLKAEKEILEKNIKSVKSKSKITKDLAKQIANGTLTVEQAVKMLDTEKVSIEEVTNAVNQYKENIENLPEPKLTWQTQLENFWNKFLNSGSKLANFSKNIDARFNEIKSKIKTFAEKNPLIIKIAKMSASSLEKVAKEIGDTMQGILDTVLGKMNFGNVFQSLFKGDIAGTLKNLFGGIIGKSEEQTKTQLASIEEQRKAELEKVEEGNQAEIDAINAKYDLLKAQAENSGFSGLMKRFNDSFEKVITKLMPVFDSLFIALDPMIEPMTQILQILALMLIEILKPMTPLLIKLMEIVGELLQALFPVIEPLMELAVVIIDLVLGVIRPFIPVLRIVAELFGTLIRVLKPIFEPFAKLFDAISPLIEPFTKLAELVGLLIKPIEWIVDMFSKITGGVGNVVSGVGGFIGDAIGGVVDFAGGIIDGIGGLFGFANGGLVTGPTKALIGEAGYPEAVIPLKSDVLSYLGQQIAMATPSNGNLNTNSMFDDFEASSGTGGDIIINLNGDNLVIDDISLQRFARQLFPKLEAERKRRGE